MHAKEHESIEEITQPKDFNSKVHLKYNKTTKQIMIRNKKKELFFF